ncbi:hypothetical protein ACOMHN_041316 [Nucella lapillus]
MNPGSVFGSGFGQPPSSSPFGTAAGSASSRSPAFGSTSAGFPPSGANSQSQIFGSVSTANTGFGNVSGPGFGLARGTDPRPPVFGSPGLGSSSGAAFGSPGPTAPGFGSATASPSFSALTSTPGFGAGGMNQNVRFGSSNVSASGFGTSSGFGIGTGSTTVTAADSSSTGAGFKGPSFGTGGGGGFGGTTAFGLTGTGSAGIGSSGFSATSTTGFGTGSSNFGTGATGFGTSAPGFGSVTSVPSSGTPTFGTTPASGFGGGSSMFSSFTSPQGTSATLPTTQTQSNPTFGGSTVFGATVKPTAAGQGFVSSSGATSQPGASVFGSKVTSSVTGFGGGQTPAFGQIPASTAVVSSGSRESVFGASAGAGSSGTPVFGAVGKAGSLGSNVGTAGSVFGSGQTAPLFGASWATQETFQTSSSAGGFGSRGVAPPSYSASISSGQAGQFTSSTTATVFGDALRTAAGGAGNVFGGAPQATSGQGIVFGGAPQATSGQGIVFGGAPQATSGQGIVFGGAPQTTSGQGNVFGGAPQTTSGQGIVFGGAPQTTSGQGNVFGGAPQTTSGQGNVFGGAPQATSGQGNVFGGAPQTASGQGSVFGGATRTTSGEGAVLGGAPKTTPGEGSSVFGRVGRSVVKQETSQQSLPQTPSAGTVVSQASVFGSSQPFGGKFPAQSDTNPSAASTHTSSSSASVFGSRSNFPSTFGGTTATQQQGAGVKTETAGSIFGGRQGNEKQESFPRPPPLFSTGSSVMSTGSDRPIKREAEPSRGTFGTATGGDSGERQGPLSTAARGGEPRRSQGAAAASLFVGKRGFPKTEAVPGAFRTESGEIEVKRGRTEREQDQGGLSTGEHSGDQPSTSSTSPERRFRRSSSIMEDVSSKTTISCKGISANLNQGSILRSHFSHFGKVVSVRPYPAKRYALVQFETHEAASMAKEHGAKLPGQDKHLSIFWKSSANKSPRSREDGAAQGRFTWARHAPAEAESARGQSALPSSVAQELASMSGADVDAGTSQRHHHPQRPRPTQDWFAARKRAGREELSSRRKDPTQQTRGRSPPPSSSSSTSAASSLPSVGVGKTTNATVASLRRMVATTTMEKVNVLDTRDKLVRQMTPKQTSGGVHSRAFVGTCPDICPEKERLYREEVRRLSIYEIIPGSSTCFIPSLSVQLTGSTSLVDHKKAVKEYSRSSADQDEPLPHELRPLPVLTMTMNYLLVEIADCGEDGKWAEWYDFLWNRTRSIRKEVTQQQLCSQEVVDLLEKCVRFHIYCAERLCAEDMMVFDSKINDENLTKCLQTLKELYADMENRHGLYCPNEAEFRAYIVLMNLNEGDTLREVQQFRSEVRSSAEIGFAVKAYSALYSNNYVRFFRLVRSASFLNACILHRYFNQIRARALQIILKSHTAGQKKVGFPLLELQRLLVFESEEEIREFCSYYGLRAERSDLCLDRSAYVEPETSIPFWRAVGLVESKRATSVGEVINGGPLQPLRLPPPQCSFDEQGRFIGSLEGLVDDSRESPEKTMPPARAPPLQPGPMLQVAAPAASTAAEAAASVGDRSAAFRQAAMSDESANTAKQQFKPTGEVLKSIARDLFFEVINEHALQVAESVLDGEQKLQQCVAHEASDLAASVVLDMTREVSGEVVEAERARHNQLLAAEKREREARVAADVLVTVIISTIKEEARGIALTEIQEEEARVEVEQRERCLLVVQSEVLGEVLGEMAGDVTDEVYQEDVVVRLQLLADLQKAVELKRTVQWLAVWRKALKVRQRQKRAMLAFPCAPPMQAANERLQTMYPDRPEHAPSLVPGKAALLVNHRARMTLLSPFESERRSLTLTAHLSLASLVNSLQRSHAWRPLNLTSVLRSPLNQAVQHWPSGFLKESTPLNIQWKLLLSLPGEMEEEEKDNDDDGDDDTTGTYRPDPLMPVLKEWLCAKFTHGDSSSTNNNAADPSKRNILSQYSTEVASNTATPSRLRVGVCVRSTPEFAKTGKGEQPTKGQSLSITKGTSAVLFLLPHADTADDTVWLAARLRLAQLLEAKPFLPATPLALLLPCRLGTTPGVMTAKVTARLTIKQFQGQGLVSDVAVVELAVRDGQPPDVAVAIPALQNQVSEAVKFLASKLPEPPNLRRERLGDVVEDMLTQHFFTPVLQDLKARLNLDKLHQAPNALIGLYNSVLDHVSLALTSPSLQDISWPPPELQTSAATREDWNSNNHLGDVYELVSSLRLPWFHYKDSASTDWNEACQDVWTFVNTVVDKRCDSAVSLASRMSRILAHACLQFENTCSLTQNEDHCTPTYVNAPWTDIVTACAEFRLQRLHNWKEEEEDVGGDTEVLYEEEDLEEFEPPAPWIQAVLDTEDTDDENQTMEDTVEQASMVHFARQPAVDDDNMTDSDAGFEHISDDNNERRSTATDTKRALPHPPPPSRSDLPENIRSAWETSENLLLHMEEERQKARYFERYLEKALRGDTSPDWSCSAISSSPFAVNATPVVSVATTPARPVSALRRRSSLMFSSPRVSLLSSREGTIRRDSSLTPRHFLEPRRLAGRDRGGVGRFAEGEEEEDAWMEERGPENASLSERVDMFQESLQAQKYANELFEKRLQSMLES